MLVTFGFTEYFSGRGSMEFIGTTVMENKEGAYVLFNNLIQVLIVNYPPNQLKRQNEPHLKIEQIFAILCKHVSFSASKHRIWAERKIFVYAASTRSLWTPHADSVVLFR